MQTCMYLCICICIYITIHTRTCNSPSRSRTPSSAIFAAKASSECITPQSCGWGGCQFESQDRFSRSNFILGRLHRPRSIYTVSTSALSAGGVCKGSRRLAFTRYCNAQYCMVYGVKTGRRKGVECCAIVLQ